ncbi:hypothetical protein [Kitasatospora camelliae]|uniref:MFS transporter n=1 Tax=Kitasatospora camelliae TaxID=3156397 RepID=A0AAU8K3B0_9ACTN
MTSPITDSPAPSSTVPALAEVPPAAPAAPAARGLRAAWAARFGGFAGPFWVVIGGTAVNRIGNMVLPFLVFFLGSRGVATACGPPPRRWSRWAWR